LEGLDGVLEDWLDGLHDTESSLHIVDLWLHTLDGLHLSGDLNEWLSVIESLEDSSGKGFLDVLDGSGLGNSGVTVTSGLGGEGGGEGGLKVDEELVFVHVVESVGTEVSTVDLKRIKFLRLLAKQTLANLLIFYLVVPDLYTLQLLA